MRLSTGCQPVYAPVSGGMRPARTSDELVGCLATIGCSLAGAADRGPESLDGRREVRTRPDVLAARLGAVAVYIGRRV